MRYYAQTTRGMTGILLSFENSIGYLSIADAKESGQWRAHAHTHTHTRTHGRTHTGSRQTRTRTCTLHLIENGLYPDVVKEAK